MINNTLTKYTVATFLEGFGDNFIVAVHPNSGIANKYVFHSDGKKLLQPGTSTEIPTALRTSILYNAAWNGFKVPGGSMKWIFDEANYTIATETLDTITPARGESYAKSILNCGCGFNLVLKYDFIRTRGDGTYGYVIAPAQSQVIQDTNPPQYKRKLSYVANSGVKFGSTGGASAGVTEINILDVEKMVELASLVKSLNNQSAFNATEIDKLVVELPSWLQVPNPPFDPPKDYTHFFEEKLSTLMHAVGYNQAYSKMDDYDSSTPITWQNYYNTLVSNKQRSGASNTMTIDLSSTVLTVTLNGQSYKDTAFTVGGDGHLYLQSHWGSGVKFTGATLQVY